MALLGGDGSEQRRVDRAGVGIETQIQIVSVERPQRMVQEVIPVEAELELLRLLMLKFLNIPRSELKKAGP